MTDYFTQDQVREMARAFGTILGEASNARDHSERALKWREALEKIAYTPIVGLESTRADDDPIRVYVELCKSYRAVCVDMTSIASDALGLDGEIR